MKKTASGVLGIFLRLWGLMRHRSEDTYSGRGRRMCHRNRDCFESLMRPKGNPARNRIRWRAGRTSFIDSIFCTRYIYLNPFTEPKEFMPIIIVCRYCGWPGRDHAFQNATDRNQQLEMLNQLVGASVTKEMFLTSLKKCPGFFAKELKVPEPEEKEPKESEMNS